MSDEPDAAFINDWIQSFRTIPATLFYTLADRKKLEAGLSYFDAKRVKTLSIDFDKKVWIAEVMGESDFFVSIGLQNQVFQHSCNCQSHLSHKNCKHVVAVVALLYLVFQKRTFTRYTGSTGYIDDITSEVYNDIKQYVAGEFKPRLVQAKPTSMASAQKTTVVKEKKENVLIFKYDERNRDYYFFPEGDTIKSKLNSLGLTITHYDGWSNAYRLPNKLIGYAETLKSFILKATFHGVPVILQTPAGERIGLQGNIIEDSSKGCLDFETCSKIVRIQHSRPADASAIKVYLSDTVCILENGNICTLSIVSNKGLAILANTHFSFNRIQQEFNTSEIANYKPTPPPVSVDNFNARALLFPLTKKGDPFENFNLSTNGQIVPQPNPKKPLPVEVKVSIFNDTTNNPGFFQVIPELFAGGIKLATSDLTHYLSLDIWSEDIDTKLFNTKGRRRCFFEAMNALFLPKTKKEQDALISEFANDKAFSQALLHHKASLWIHRLIRHWLNVKNGSHIQCFPQNENPWCVVASPHALFAKATLCTRWLHELLEVPLKQDVQKQVVIYNIPDTKLFEFIQKASIIFKACGIELVYNQQAILRLPIQVAVEINEHKDLDWFELKAEVTCGKLKIKQEEWEKLIRGELLLEQDGALLVPELTQEEAIQQLSALFGSTKRKPGKKSAAQEIIAKVPRLQILDWMMMRKSGAKVKLPKEVEKILSDLVGFTEIPSVTLPTEVTATLRDYQKQGVDWLVFLYEHRFGACLADDMGLGKTVQAIAFLAWLKHNSTKQKYPHLVVVPPSLVFNWRHEIERFCPSMKIGEYIGNNRELSKTLANDLILTTYDFVRRDIGELAKQRFDVVIFDEAQTLKNLTSARTQSAVQLQRSFTLCLTGTPMENHAGEYFSIMNLALPGIFGDYKNFVNSLKEGDVKLLRRVAPFMLRRTKDKILKELPPKVESDLYLDMTEEQKEIYTLVVSEVRAEVLEAFKGKTRAQAGIVALAALMRLRQVCISPELLGKTLKQPAPKIAYLLDKMEELRDEGHAALVFSQFTRTLDLLEEAASKIKLPTLRLDGSTPVAKRKAIVEKFQNDPQAYLFLISLKAGGVGLNLTRAQYVFHADPWWNPAVENQASDRAHRIGQKNTVFIQRVLMRHSVEEKIMELKRRKQALFNAIVDASSESKTNGTLIAKEDFEYLLS